MFKRALFNADHDAFRDTVRRFIAHEIAPHHAGWEAAGVVSRELWLKAGAAGMLCCTVPEQYGGIGADYLFDVVVFDDRGAGNGGKGAHSVRRQRETGECPRTNDPARHRGRTRRRRQRLP